MSRRRQLEALRAESERTARRQGVAHRSVRKRAERGKPRYTPALAPMPPVPRRASPPSADAVAEPVIQVLDLTPDEWTVEEPPRSSKPKSKTKHKPKPAPKPAPKPEPEPEPEQAPAASDVFPAQPKERRRPSNRTLLLTGCALVAVAYLGAQWWAAGQVPQGTTVDGTAVGARDQAAATAVVAGLAQDAEATPVSLSVGDQAVTMLPTDAGLAVDVHGTVAQFTGFTLAPTRLWDFASGGDDHPLLSTVDQPALTAAVDASSQPLNSDTVEGRVDVVNGQAIASPATVGVSVDPVLSADAVAAAWPAEPSFELVAEVTPPEVSTADALALAETLTAQVLNNPVVLTGPNGDIEIAAASVAQVLSVEHVDGELVPVVTGAASIPGIATQAASLGNAPVDAALNWDDDQQLMVEPGTPGRAVDLAALDAAVLQAAMSPTHTAAIPYAETAPAVTADELETSDYTELVASFDTPLTNDRVRTANLALAASRARGSVLHPGDEFNLRQTLEPVTVEGGYQSAGIIDNGIHTEGVGGGLSQMATTTYNAAYFAGYEILQFRPHSVHFDRYPAGRESTIFGYTINVRFVNNTPYAAVINSYVKDNRLHVDIWSTPHWRVETEASARTNVRQPTTREVDDPRCEPSGAGEPGFTITNTRRIYLDDELVSEEPFTWTYRPDDAIKCAPQD